MSIKTIYASSVLESMKKAQKEKSSTLDTVVDPRETPSEAPKVDKPKRGRKKNDVHTDTSK